MLLMAALGTLGAIVIALLTPVLVNRVLEIPVALRSEALDSFILLAVSVC